MNLPNKLTLARCVMAVVFVALMSFESSISYFLAFVLFLAAIATDYWDGKIARERNCVTNFGKLLDPVADKVLMVAGFVMLITIPELRIPGWALVAIFAREFLVTGARALAASDGTVIPANKWGKIKTILQMVYVAVFVFFAFFLRLAGTHSAVAAALPGGLPLFRECIGWASLVSVVLVALYTVYSGVQFARVNWKRLNLTG